MLERQPDPIDALDPLAMDAPIPAARPLSDFCVERVGEDVVLFDSATMQYHTLNNTAYRVWQSCDGMSTLSAIARMVDIPLELVEVTIAELGEASLLTSPSNIWNSTFSRRRAARLIAAGFAGAVGLPIVKSITAPDAASAVSPSRCLGACNNGGNCSQNCPSGAKATCQPIDGGGGFCCAC